MVEIAFAGQKGYWTVEWSTWPSNGSTGHAIIAWIFTGQGGQSEGSEGEITNNGGSAMRWTVK
jgi:hypothetical protein